jgi:hypothetical protein
MADWMDWLEGLSGAASGVAKGWNEGLAPLKTWEDIRTGDLKNDAQEIGNRNLEFEQQYREGADVPAWYGDWGGARRSEFQDTISKNELDMWGNRQKQDTGQRLADADAAFRVAARAAGLTPDMPEYAQLAGQYLRDATGFGAIEQVDKYNIDARLDRATGDQATLASIQNTLRDQTGDKNLVVTRGKDGKLYMQSSDGVVHEVTNPKALMEAASMYYEKGSPEGAIRAGIKDLIEIQKANADNWVKYNAGKITPKEMLTGLTNERVGINQALNNARDMWKNQKATLERDSTKSDTEKAALLQPYEDELRRQAKALDNVNARWNMVANGQRMGGGAGGTGGGTGAPRAMFNPITGMPMIPGAQQGAGPKSLGSSPAAAMSGTTSLNAPSFGFDRPDDTFAYSDADALSRPDDTFGYGPAQAAGGAPPASRLPRLLPGGPGTGGPNSPIGRFMQGLTQPASGGGPGSRYPGRPQQPPQVPPTSSTSQMSPEQMMAYLQYMAPFIQSQNQGPAGGGDVRQLLAMLQQHGMVG